jgi:competence protein ComEA
MEGRSLLKGGALLLALAVLRFGADQWRHPGRIVEGGGTDLEWLLDESRQARDDRARRSRPLAPGETVDPNWSPEEELNRLPGVGPVTAKAVVEDREKRGGFRSAEDLLRVRGIGPATLERIRPFLSLSGEVPSLPGEVPPGAQDPAVRRLDLNHASAEELQALPGIGPALAARILESRARDGPFRTPEDLLRVRGIGPATLARLRDLVIAGIG